MPILNDVINRLATLFFKDLIRTKNRFIFTSCLLAYLYKTQFTRFNGLLIPKSPQHFRWIYTLLDKNFQDGLFENVTVGYSSKLIWDDVIKILWILTIQIERYLQSKHTVDDPVGTLGPVGVKCYSCTVLHVLNVTSITFGPTTYCNRLLQWTPCNNEGQLLEHQICIHLSPSRLH